MKKICKIETVFPSVYQNNVLQILEDAGVAGFTMIEVKKGKGLKSGESFSSGSILANKNLYLFTICEEENCAEVTRLLSNFLQEIGGMVISYPVASY